jgi:hypothetical protein
MKNLKLTDLPWDVIRYAVKASGVNPDEIDDVTDDLQSDTFWNDPKEAGRKINVCGGDRVIFFDELEGVDWGE